MVHLLVVDDKYRKKIKIASENPVYKYRNRERMVSQDSVNALIYAIKVFYSNRLDDGVNREVRDLMERGYLESIRVHSSGKGIQEAVIIEIACADEQIKKTKGYIIDKVAVILKSDIETCNSNNTIDRDLLSSLRIVLSQLDSAVDGNLIYSVEFKKNGGTGSRKKVKRTSTGIEDVIVTWNPEEFGFLDVTLDN